jgi:hypothetical protein
MLAAASVLLRRKQCATVSAPSFCFTSAAACNTAIGEDGIAVISAMKSRDSQPAKAMPGDNQPLQAREAEQILAPGIDVGLDKPEPATSWTALRGYMKVGQHERFHTLAWYLAIILAIVAVGVILGIQML